MSLCDGVPGRSFAGIALSRADSVIIVVIVEDDGWRAAAAMND